MQRMRTALTSFLPQKNSLKKIQGVFFMSDVLLDVVFGWVAAFSFPTVDLTGLGTWKLQADAVATGMRIRQKYRTVFNEYFFNGFLLFLWQRDNTTLEFANLCTFDARLIGDIPGRNSDKCTTGTGKIRVEDMLFFHIRPPLNI